ncbi:unnamed protein product [Neospora caninum Liverpool]|nr:uncharacterized protein NCLIV_022440 [Neospora caninum Liverpool]CBZ52455.1 unnamed protein product [Neospora caninum Liverpool]|eukprot:XP_003882487.1 uncharacterized protein NCLIV_022440 [Neospora caninum Liverpool]
MGRNKSPETAETQLSPRGVRRSSRLHPLGADGGQPDALSPVAAAPSVVRAKSPRLLLPSCFPPASSPNSRIAPHRGGVGGPAGGASGVERPTNVDGAEVAASGSKRGTRADRDAVSETRRSERLESGKKALSSLFGDTHNTPRAMTPIARTAGLVASRLPPSALVPASPFSGDRQTPRKLSPPQGASNLRGRGFRGKLKEGAIESRRNGDEGNGEGGRDEGRTASSGRHVPKKAVRGRDDGAVGRRSSRLQSLEASRCVAHEGAKVVASSTAFPVGASRTVAALDAPLSFASSTDASPASSFSFSRRNTPRNGEQGSEETEDAREQPIAGRTRAYLALPQKDESSPAYSMLSRLRGREEASPRAPASASLANRKELSVSETRQPARSQRGACGVSAGREEPADRDERQGGGLRRGRRDAEVGEPEVKREKTGELEEVVEEESSVVLSGVKNCAFQVVTVEEVARRRKKQVVRTQRLSARAQREQDQLRDILQKQFGKRGSFWGGCGWIPAPPVTTAQEARGAGQKTAGVSTAHRSQSASHTWQPFIFCPYFGEEHRRVYRHRHPRLYKALLACVQEGKVHDGVQVIRLLDFRHPVRLVTPEEEDAYSLRYVGPRISAEHRERVIFGEYTGYVSSDEDLRADHPQYCFQLKFHREAFRDPHLVRTRGDDEGAEAPRRGCGKSEKAEQKKPERGGPRKCGGDRAEETFQDWDARDDRKAAAGLPSLSSPPLVSIPHDEMYAVDSTDEFNEMSMVNHFQTVDLFGRRKCRINAEWQVVYVDAWPHIVLTSIPGVPINPGEELLADFGYDWFDQINAQCMRYCRRQLQAMRLRDKLSAGALRAFLREQEEADEEEDETFSTDQLCFLCYANQKPGKETPRPGERSEARQRGSTGQQPGGRESGDGDAGQDGAEGAEAEKEEEERETGAEQKPSSGGASVRRVGNREGKKGGGEGEQVEPSVGLSRRRQGQAQPPKRTPLGKTRRGERGEGRQRGNGEETEDERNEKEERGIVCDGCNRAYHLECIHRTGDPPSDEYEWFCPLCILFAERVNETRQTRRQDEEKRQTHECSLPLREDTDGERENDARDEVTERATNLSEKGDQNEPSQDLAPSVPAIPSSSSSSSLSVVGWPCQSSHEDVDSAAVCLDSAQPSLSCSSASLAPSSLERPQNLHASGTSPPPDSETPRSSCLSSSDSASLSSPSSSSFCSSSSASSSSASSSSASSSSASLSSASLSSVASSSASSSSSSLSSASPSSLSLFFASSTPRQGDPAVEGGGAEACASPFSPHAPLASKGGLEPKLCPASSLQSPSASAVPASPPVGALPSRSRPGASSVSPCERQAPETRANELATADSGAGVSSLPSGVPPAPVPSPKKAQGVRESPRVVKPRTVFSSVSEALAAQAKKVQVRPSPSAGEMTAEQHRGRLTDQPTLPESPHLSTLLPCRACRSRFGDDANGVTCRIFKLHLEKNFSDPGEEPATETPLEICHDIITALRKVVMDYRREELDAQAAAAPPAVPTACTDADHAKESEETKDGSFEARDFPDLVSGETLLARMSRPSHRFVPLLGVYLGATKLERRRPAGVHVGRVARLIRDAEDGAPKIVVKYEDGDQEIFSPKYFMTELLCQALRPRQHVGASPFEFLFRSDMFPYISRETRRHTRLPIPQSSLCAASFPEGGWAEEGRGLASPGFSVEAELLQAVALSGAMSVAGAQFSESRSLVDCFLRVYEEEEREETRSETREERQRRLEKCLEDDWAAVFCFLSACLPSLLVDGREKRTRSVFALSGSALDTLAFLCQGNGQIGHGDDLSHRPFLSLLASFSTRASSSASSTRPGGSDAPRSPSKRRRLGPPRGEDGDCQAAARVRGDKDTEERDGAPLTGWVADLVSSLDAASPSDSPVALWGPGGVLPPVGLYLAPDEEIEWGDEACDVDAASPRSLAVFPRPHTAAVANAVAGAAASLVDMAVRRRGASPKTAEHEKRDTAPVFLSRSVDLCLRKNEMEEKAVDAWFGRPPHAPLATAAVRVCSGSSAKGRRREGNEETREAGEFEEAEGSEKTHARDGGQRPGGRRAHALADRRGGSGSLFADFAISPVRESTRLRGAGERWSPSRLGRVYSFPHGGPRTAGFPDPALGLSCTWPSSHSSAASSPVLSANGSSRGFPPLALPSSLLSSPPVAFPPPHKLPATRRAHGSPASPVSSHRGSWHAPRVSPLQRAESLASVGRVWYEADGDAWVAEFVRENGRLGRKRFLCEKLGAERAERLAKMKARLLVSGEEGQPISRHELLLVQRHQHLISLHREGEARLKRERRQLEGCEETASAGDTDARGDPGDGDWGGGEVGRRGGSGRGKGKRRRMGGQDGAEGSSSHRQADGATGKDSVDRSPDPFVAAPSLSSFSSASTEESSETASLLGEKFAHERRDLGPSAFGSSRGPPQGASPYPLPLSSGPSPSPLAADESRGALGFPRALAGLTRQPREETQGPFGAADGRRPPVSPALVAAHWASYPALQSSQYFPPSCSSDRAGAGAFPCGPFAAGIPSFAGCDTARAGFPSAQAFARESNFAGGSPFLASFPSPPVAFASPTFRPVGYPRQAPTPAPSDSVLPAPAPPLTFAAQQSICVDALLALARSRAASAGAGASDAVASRTSGAWPCFNALFSFLSERRMTPERLAPFWEAFQRLFVSIGCVVSASDVPRVHSLVKMAVASNPGLGEAVAMDLDAALQRVDATREEALRVRERESGCEDEVARAKEATQRDAGGEADGAHEGKRDPEPRRAGEEGARHGAAGPSLQGALGNGTNLRDSTTHLFVDGEDDEGLEGGGAFPSRPPTSPSLLTASPPLPLGASPACEAHLLAPSLTEACGGAGSACSEVNEPCSRLSSPRFVPETRHALPGLSTRSSGWFSPGQNARAFAESCLLSPSSGAALPAHADLVGLEGDVQARDERGGGRRNADLPSCEDLGSTGRREDASPRFLLHPASLPTLSPSQLEDASLLRLTCSGGASASEPFLGEKKQKEDDETAAVCPLFS